MTITEAISKSNIDPKLFRAVVRTAGKENMKDIAGHGANAGWPGFTYYHDTISFFKKHRKARVEMAISQANEFGVSAIEMVQGFGQYRGTDWKNQEGISITNAIGSALHGGRIDEREDYVAEIANLMSWYALEEVARTFDE